MKKLVLLTTAILIITSVSGCASEKNQSEVIDEPVITTETTEATEPAPEYTETVIYESNYCRISFMGIEKFSYFGDDDGVSIKLKAENLTNDDNSITLYDISINGYEIVASDYFKKNISANEKTIDKISLSGDRLQECGINLEDIKDIRISGYSDEGYLGDRLENIDISFSIN